MTEDYEVEMNHGNTPRIPDPTEMTRYNPIDAVKTEVKMPIPDQAYSYLKSTMGITTNPIQMAPPNAQAHSLLRMPNLYLKSDGVGTSMLTQCTPGVRRPTRLFQMAHRTRRAPEG